MINNQRSDREVKRCILRIERHYKYNIVKHLVVGYAYVVVVPFLLLNEQSKFISVIVKALTVEHEMQLRTDNFKKFLVAKT